MNLDMNLMLIESEKFQLRQVILSNLRKQSISSEKRSFFSIFKLLNQETLIENILALNLDFQLMQIENSQIRIDQLFSKNIKQGKNGSSLEIQNSQAKLSRSLFVNNKIDAAKA